MNWVLGHVSVFTLFYSCQKMIGNDTRAISKSSVEQLQVSDVEELKYLLKDNFAGKFYLS